ncbi:MAG: Gfo/Idh/MocA family oxidoreductase [Kiritimatiellaeota bacterium]|nr:Gfo/Idh/MocA family oxidoreductase [Kiritimatiellota bacterium]
MAKHSELSRRVFLRRALTVGTVFQIVPSRLVFGGPKAPSNTITRAVIGTGGMGMGHVTKYPQTLAVCDVDRNHLANAAKKAGGQVKAYTDWREVLDRDDIDTVHIPTPPHWHALIAIAAAQAGKDVYSEKPATHTIAEGKALVETMARYGTVYQVNTWGRQIGHFARKVVASGILGTPLKIYLNPSNCPTGFKIRQWSGKPNLPVRPVPPELDYGMWTGPAPVKPYNPLRVHQRFRGYWDYDEGGFGDMGQHHVDPVQYAIGKDDTAPIEVEAIAPPQHPDACGLWQTIFLKYADGTEMTIESWEWGEKTTEGRAWIEGPNGKLWRNGKLEPAQLAEELKRYPAPPPLQSWEHAVRTRENVHGFKPNVEQATRSAEILHLASIAVRLGRKLRFDPDTHRFIDDPEANRLAYPPRRAPWGLPVA